jgi:uncharacterized transporter YbjL
MSSRIEKVVQEYKELDQTIQKINKDVHQKRLQRKKLETEIRDYMTQQKLDKLSTEKGSLKLKKISKKKLVNKDFVASKMGESMTKEQCESLTELIFGKDDLQKEVVEVY